VAEDRSTLAATAAEGERAERLARAGLELLEGAAGLPAGTGRSPAHVEASLADGSVFALRHGTFRIVATTVPRPTSGLVLYDLRACLRSLAEPPPRKRRPRKKEAAA
jgi:hypothetical protein